MNVRRISLTTLANGGELAVYLHELGGTHGDGPTVGICAAIHGDEPTGTRIVLQLARRLANRAFRGRLLLLPVANPLGFEAMKRSTPLDALNLNRVFPGNREGWLTEQLATVITEAFLTKVDILIDLHSGGACQTVDYVYILNAENLSRSFGSRVLYRPHQGLSGTMFRGTATTITAERGTPTVVVELGGGQVDQRPYVARGVEGIMNILRALNVVEGVPLEIPEQVVINEIVTVRPHMGGLLETAAPSLGQEVAGGEILGRVLSPYTFEELEVVRNPLGRGIMILSHLTTDVVGPGDYGYMIGNLESGEGR
ncbi:MAG TPA: succinate dehydrogenase [Candidatus Fraserbacteria bacterium]|nr:succinate dehydrogenase [Candidatus Fraserbacteria bacterium]